MPVTPDRIARLRGFGLSEYAARSYLALLDLGTAEARDVAGLSKVPASKIYHILDQLHEKGLVVILPEFPRKYAPVPFSDFLRRIHDEHALAAQRIEEEQDELAEAFAILGQTSAGDRGSVTVLRGRRNVAERAQEVLATARESISVLFTEKRSMDAPAWDRMLDEARERGLEVRTLGDDTSPRPTALPGATFVLLVDGRRAFVGHCMPDDGHPSEGNDTALDLDQEGIVGLLDALLLGQWGTFSSGKMRLRVDAARPEDPLQDTP